MSLNPAAHTADVCTGIMAMDKKQKLEETTQLSAPSSQWPEKVASKYKERHQQMPRNSVIFFPASSVSIFPSCFF